MSELLWIAVPGGAVRPDGNAPLALLIVPRLTGTGDTLAAYGMDRWPALLKGTTFTLEFRGHATVPVTPIQPLAAEQAQPRWDALFLAPPKVATPGWVQVRSWAQPAQRDLDILDTGAEATAIQDAYAQELVGAAPRTLRLGPSAERRRARSARRAARVADAGPAPAPRLDFHERLALLREHPRVLRAVGLIVDFAVTVPTDATAVRLIPATPAWPTAPAPTHVTPWTMCQLAAGRFLPEPRPGSGIAGGVVSIGGAGLLAGSQAPADMDWAVVSYDVEAAMTRLGATQEDGPLPPLRSAGLSLLRLRREQELTQRMSARGGSQPAEVDGLFADDLVLGYRLDVRLPEAGWQSLCRRTADYRVAGEQLDPPSGTPEEGHVKPDAVTSDGTAGGMLEGDQIVVRWDGWSIAVPPPVPGAAPVPERVIDLDSRLSVVAPLPKLRFGQHYFMRARVADLAGAGLTVEDLAADDVPAQRTRELHYGRVEPIPAPVLIAPQGVSAPGGALERLVIRSAGGPGPATGAAPPPDVRLLCAPPTSVELADQHGVFDAHTPEDSWALAQRAIQGLDGAPAAEPQAAQPVPWLADALAQRWILRPVNPGLDEQGARWDGAENWSHQPVTLVLAPGAVTGWSEATGRLTLALAPAGDIDIDLSSAPREGFTGVELTLNEWVDGSAAAKVLADVGDGRQSHITPARRLRLVHAVQRPLAAPRASFAVERGLHDTFALIEPAAAVAFDRASTVRLDLAASWQEWADAPQPIGERSAIIASETVPLQGDFALPPERHEFGDTRRRRVTYTLTAVSRFQEFFDPALLTSDPKAFSVEGPPVAVDVPSSARPPAPVVEGVVPAFVWQRTGAPPGWTEWTSARKGGLLRIELGPGWFASGEGEQLAILLATEEFPARGLWAFLSATGRDPVHATADTARWLSASDVAAPGATEVWLEEAQAKLLVLPLTPSHTDAAGAPWFADADLGALAAGSYRPFVELALARYQPVSLDRVALSPAVRTDMIQLAPARSLHLRRGPAAIVASLTGVGPTEAPNRVEAWIERWSGPGAPSTELTDLGGAGAVSWTRVAGATATGALGADLTVPLPAGGAAPQRIVVRETEEVPGRAPQPGPLGGELSRQLVFVETVIV